MQHTIFALALATSFVSAQSATGASASPGASLVGAVIPVGASCVPGGTPCALGSQCYAVNSMLQPVCGNFQTSCTSNQQCAFNTCNGGLCNGLLASASASQTPTGVFSGAPSSTVTAPAGSLPLGAQCNPFASPSQCAAGVQCFASNAGLIAACGNFNAACSSDAQCAFNTCSNGLCNGLKPSGSSNAAPSAMPSRTPTQSASAASSMLSRAPTQSAPSGSTMLSRTPTRSASSTSILPQFTGAASSANVAGGVVALVLGSVAWIL